MGDYASSSDVVARIPYPTLDTNSTPSTTQISSWIDKAEARLNNALRAAQVAPVPVTDSDGVSELNDLVTSYAEGRTRAALAAAGGDGDNEDGQDLIDDFEELLKDIQKHPSWYEAKFNQGSASSSTRRLRGAALDNSDGDSISDGDFGPTFTREEAF